MPASLARLRDLVPARARVIIDNDFSGDPDGLLQLAHHLLSPSVEIRAVIGSHLRPGDPFDPSEVTAENAARAALDVVTLAGLAGHVPVVAGSNVGLSDRATPIRSAATDAIIAEAMRDDTELPLYLACGAGLTEVASAWLLEPRIAERLTLVWIGGPEHSGLAVPPPGSTGAEYNLNIDLIAGQVVFGDSDIPIWQIPRDAYRQTLLSTAELITRVGPGGALGAHLERAITRVSGMAGAHGIFLGETYIAGDSPLVLLTALQSAFEADPSSSDYVVRPTPSFDDVGEYVEVPDARRLRIYTRLDVRLMFDDLFAKLGLLAAS
ncbi:nucleoside hydrolase [Agreia pratensis]|uniref:Inosine-uridine preferring nucleoside hydrolase n=1 Tax=Agreia pratensis TaxID=150121 RepID=A0A1X7IV15_9MICO|nr:nucleoside hydrolase [Agreia pratensis]SMG19055.1 Inosine-uridine preferring nucleoside hydrolase [Agreia pratensis]